jgi:hypothetical protein
MAQDSGAVISVLDGSNKLFRRATKPTKQRLLHFLPRQIQYKLRSNKVNSADLPRGSEIKAM